MASCDIQGFWRFIMMLNNFGSPGWIRTSNQSVTRSPSVSRRSGLYHHPSHACRVRGASTRLSGATPRGIVSEPAPHHCFERVRGLAADGPPQHPPEKDIGIGFPAIHLVFIPRFPWEAALHHHAIPGDNWHKRGRIYPLHV